MARALSGSKSSYIHPSDPQDSTHGRNGRFLYEYTALARAEYMVCEALLKEEYSGLRNIRKAVHVSRDF